MKQPRYLSSCVLLPQPLVSCSASWAWVFYSLHTPSPWQNSRSYAPSQPSPLSGSKHTTSRGLQHLSFISGFATGARDGCWCGVALCNQNNRGRLREGEGELVLKPAGFPAMESGREEESSCQNRLVFLLRKAGGRRTAKGEGSRAPRQQGMSAFGKQQQLSLLNCGQTDT